MATQELDEQTYFPANDGELNDIVRFIQAHDAPDGDGHALGYPLRRPDDSEQVELPDSVRQALRLIVEAMAAGQAVTITPRDPS